MSQKTKLFHTISNGPKIGEVKRSEKGGSPTSACREFYFIPDASHKIFRMSDISAAESSHKVHPNTIASRCLCDCANTGAHFSFFRPAMAPSCSLAASLFFFARPVKDDSAENGMPLAFLISAFCHPLSANGRDRAIVARIPRHVRHRGIFARKMYISGCPAMPRFTIFAGALSLDPPRSGKNYSVPKRDASRVITTNTPLEL